MANEILLPLEKDSTRQTTAQPSDMGKVFTYNGAPITFSIGSSVMVNATEMAKPFDKNASHWLRNQSTQEFLNELAALRNCKGSDLVQVENGVGCWMHEDVALEFARWLSPAFAIWCNDRIKELMRYGMTATQPTIDQMIENPDLIIKLATQLKNEREEKARLRLEAEENRPKVTFAEAVEKSENSILIAQLAKMIKQNGVDMGQNRLFKWMRANGYLCKHGDYYNTPTQKAMDMGLFEIQVRTICLPDGTTRQIRTPLVTGKGQIYFVDKFLKRA